MILIGPLITLSALGAEIYALVSDPNTMTITMLGVSSFIAGATLGVSWATWYFRGFS